MNLRTEGTLGEVSEVTFWCWIINSPASHDTALHLQCAPVKFLTPAESRVIEDWLVGHHRRRSSR